MSSRLRTALIALVVVLILAAVAFYFLDADARLKGGIAGEPKYDGRSASAWVRDLSGGDENARARAAEKLKAGGPAAVPVLEAALKSGAPEARWRAADVIGQIGPPAKAAGPALIAALKDADSTVREVAAQALGKLAPDVPGAVTALAENFPDVFAIRAVAEYGMK